MSAGYRLRTGVLGVGRMGLPVVRRLVAAGFPVAVRDPDPARTRLAVSAGAVPLADPSAAQVLVTVLPGAAEVARVLPGFVPVLAPGTVWLDLTSGDPRTTDRLAGELAERDVATVTAAMGGGPADAAAGSLDLFVGGPAGQVARVEPLLSVLTSGGGSVRRLGDRAGDGQTGKLLANLLWFAESVAVTEALLLARSTGLDVHAVQEALVGSSGDSTFLRRHVQHLLAGDHLTDFALARCVEELETLAAMADGAGVPFDLHRGVLELHRAALAQFGPVDGELLAAHLLELRSGGPLAPPR